VGCEAVVHDQTLITCIDSYLHFRSRSYDDQPEDTPSSAGAPRLPSQANSVCAESARLPRAHEAPGTSQCACRRGVGDSQSTSAQVHNCDCCPAHASPVRKFNQEFAGLSRHSTTTRAHSTRDVCILRIR
jgi:hypothetical protein